MTRFLKSLLGLGLVLAVAPTHAQEGSPAPSAARLTLEMRGDWDHASFNEVAKTGGKSDSSDMIMSVGQLNWQGSFDQDLSYRLRLRFNNEGTTRGPDSLSSRVDYAFLRHQVGPWRFTLGKQNTEIGGFETNGAGEDLYFKSDANLALNGDWKDPSGGITFTPALKYQTGVRAGYQLENLELALIATNHPESETAAAPKPQTRVFSGAMITWQPRSELSVLLTSHGVARSSEQATALEASRLDTQALGLLWDDKENLAQLDLIAARAGPHRHATLGFERTAELSSLVLLVGRRWGAWFPKIKLEHSRTLWQGATGLDDDTSTRGSGVIFEYQAKPKVLRYQAAWTRKDRSLSGAESAVEDHVLIGFTLKAALIP